MSKEILYRAKNKETGEWVIGFPITDKWIQCLIPDCKCKHDGSEIAVMYYWDYTSHEFCECEIDPETICQYIGLKDSAGRKIFESDFLKYWCPTYECDAMISLVVDCSDKEYPAFDLLPFNDPICNGLAFVMAENECEIIGNKFDNPELMPGERC
jgi:hypothetical protein